MELAMAGSDSRKEWIPPDCDPLAKLYVYPWPLPRTGESLDQHPECSSMPFVVTDSCIRCKYMDCVSVCPVSCFYEGQTMLVIRQSDCIDCGICEPECPVEAIVPDSHPRAAMWIELNEKYSESWPNVTEHRDPPPDADHFKTIPNKYPRFFSPLPSD
jgi:ferredoxin